MTTSPRPHPHADLQRRAQALTRLLDDHGRIIRWPKKRWQQEMLVEYVSEALPGRERWTEGELGMDLDGLHTFGDRALLRRELVEAGCLARDAAGREYWRPDSA